MKRWEIPTNYYNVGIILDEISQTEEDKYCMILQVESKKAEPIETESRMVVTRGWGAGKEAELFNGYRVSVLQHEKAVQTAEQQGGYILCR